MSDKIGDMSDKTEMLMIRKKRVLFWLNYYTSANTQVNTLHNTVHKLIHKLSNTQANTLLNTQKLVRAILITHILAAH